MKLLLWLEDRISNEQCSHRAYALEEAKYELEKIGQTFNNVKDRQRFPRRCIPSNGWVYNTIVNADVIFEDAAFYMSPSALDKHTSPERQAAFALLELSKPQGRAACPTPVPHEDGTPRWWHRLTEEEKKEFLDDQLNGIYLQNLSYLKQSITK